jgi:flagellar basal-body rod protein FlgG
MINGIYQSAGGMLVNEYRQNVIANNIANADTVGFQRDLAVFAERPNAARDGQWNGASAASLDDASGGTWLGRTHIDFRGGHRVSTGEPLDAALNGQGFFAVNSGGRTLYTRDGRFALDSNGVLVAASDGAPIVGRGGLPIRTDPSRGNVTIDSGGRVLQNNDVMGQLQIVDFANPFALQKAGAARLDAGNQPPIDSPADVEHKVLEQSTVEAIPEMTAMIEASRAYQMNAQMISLQDQTLARLISTVSRA